MSAWLCSLVNGLKHQRVAVLSVILSPLILLLLSFNVYANSKPTYVGSEACVDCHSEEVKAWQGSHHDMA
ncbi:hypothetical protein AB4491_23130, partial [Vibrio sp. 10N.261.45.A7]